jgi:hypothetical protein
MPKRAIPNPEIEVEKNDEIENEVIEPEPEIPKTPKKVTKKKVPDPDLGSDDETIEIKKPPKLTPMYKREKKAKDPNAPKKERTPAQIAAWERCCAARKAREAERYALREKEMEDIKKYKESLAKKQTRNVIKKAVNVKKKYAVVDEVLDDISDGEDIPLEVVKHAIKERRARAQTASRQQRQPQPNTEYYEEDFVPARPILRFV